MIKIIFIGLMLKFNRHETVLFQSIEADIARMMPRKFDRGIFTGD